MYLLKLVQSHNLGDVGDKESYALIKGGIYVGGVSWGNGRAHLISQDKTITLNSNFGKNLDDFNLGEVRSKTELFQALLELNAFSDVHLAKPVLKLGV